MTAWTVNLSLSYPRPTGGSQYPESQVGAGFWIPACAGMTIFGAGLSPPLNPRLHCAHLVRLKGVSRGDLEAGRGAAPAGSCTQHGHSGGSGAPPGPNTRCRELADCAYGGVRADRKSEAGPGAGDAAMARREALACRKARTIYGPRLSARRPPLCKEGERADPGCGTRIAATKMHVCKPLAGGVGCARLTRDPRARSSL